jgi:hypothetical protein
MGAPPKMLSARAGAGSEVPARSSAQPQPVLLPQDEQV